MPMTTKEEMSHANRAEDEKVEIDSPIQAPKVQAPKIVRRESADDDAEILQMDRVGRRS